MPSVLPRLSSSPPGAQTRLDRNPTLIVSWFCTIFSLVVILIRVIGRYVRTETLFREDKVMLWSIVPLLIRMAVVHPILLWGTNNIDTAGVAAEDIYHRSIGSRLVLVSRIFYAIYIWTAKVTVLEFMRKIIATSWTRFYERGVKIIYTFLGLALAAVIIATLAECRPFSHYWQVLPDPGPSCRTGSAQLITMGTCDIVTDIVLIIFPIPLVMGSKMPVLKKASMICLFLLSIILIAITAYRIPSTMARGYRQQYRSLLASWEILAATIVANVIVIGSFLRDKGVKKKKYQHRVASVALDDGEDYTLTRPATRQTQPSVAQKHWGSDEDLVRDFGLTLSKDLRHDSAGSRAPRLASVVDPTDISYRDAPSAPQPTINPQGRGLLDPSWTFRKGSHQHGHGRRDSDASTDSESSTDFKLHKLEPYTDEPTNTAVVPETPYKKMSFFDVGGLVDLEASEESSMDQSTRRVSTAMRSGSISRSGQNFIADVGGLFGTPGLSNRVDDEKITPVSSNTGYRPRNIISLEQTIRERSRSPSHQVTVAEALREQPHKELSTPKNDLRSDADSLDFLDAGGLLK